MIVNTRSVETQIIKTYLDIDKDKMAKSYLDNDKILIKLIIS